MARAEENGAVLDDAVSDATTHVIAKRSVTEAEAIARLGQGCRLVLPPVFFVAPTFISDCLCERQLLPETPYLIDLQRRCRMYLDLRVGRGSLPNYCRI